MGVVKVSDERLDFLGDYHKAKKITPVTVEYLDIPGLTGEEEPGREIGDAVLAHIRPVDALVHCVRFFESPVLGPSDPAGDFERVEDEMILSDLGIVERRLERVERDLQRGRKELAEEADLLKQARTLLEEGKPLRLFPPAVESDKLRGFAFLSSKPELILLNSGDDKTSEEIREAMEKVAALVTDQSEVTVDWLYADAEAEIARLEPDEASEFMEELGLDEMAGERIVRKSFELLKLIVFITAGEKEVRAWPLRLGGTAYDAAGVLHTDMQRGFIRAEVMAYDDFKSAGSTAEVQKLGKLRLEGKEYIVRDGDIILFRFNI